MPGCKYAVSEGQQGEGSKEMSALDRIGSTGIPFSLEAPLDCATQQ